MLYDINIIMRVTPVRSVKKDSYVGNANILNYFESRVLHLIKMLHRHPIEMSEGEINLDMKIPASFDYLDVIVLMCIINNESMNIKINLLNTTISERINICRSLNMKFTKNSMYIPYEQIAKLLLNLKTEVPVETDGMNITI